MTIQQQADRVIDSALDAELASAFQKQCRRLAKAQALAWQSLTRGEQFSYLSAVDALERLQ